MGICNHCSQAKDGISGSSDVLLEDCSPLDHLPTSSSVGVGNVQSMLPSYLPGWKKFFFLQYFDRALVNVMILYENVFSLGSPEEYVNTSPGPLEENHSCPQYDRGKYLKSSPASMRGEV